MNEKIPVVCLNDYIAYFDVTDASWDKEVFIMDILKCCDGRAFNTFGTRWKYYNENMEELVTWKQF